MSLDVRRMGSEYLLGNRTLDISQHRTTMEIYRMQSERSTPELHPGTKISMVA